MEIRLMGTEDECREVAGRLAAVVDVLEVSEPRPNRGDSRQVRMFVIARLGPGSPSAVIPWGGEAAYLDAGNLIEGIPDKDLALFVHYLAGYLPQLLVNEAEWFAKRATDKQGKGGRP
jgi:hypothetical protein